MPTEKRAVFLQVRLGSTRLPGKALLPLREKPIVAWAMERLRRVEVDEYWLVADEKSAEELTPVASQYGYQVFGGDPVNVLKRFVDCAQRAEVDWIVRATGDNPLVAWELAERSLQLCAAHQLDYAGITGTPYGTGIEVCSAAALMEVYQTTTSEYDQEHVTPGIYQNPGRFRMRLEEAPAELYLPQASVTIDTPSDYQRVIEIFAHIEDPAVIPLQELVALLRSRPDFGGDGARGVRGASGDGGTGGGTGGDGARG